MKNFFRCFAFIGLLIGSAGAVAAEALPTDVKDVGVFPKIGVQLDLSTPFQDEIGMSLPLSSYFDGKHPVALILNYYGCPMLCGVMLNQAREIFEAADWKMGDKYKVVTISIDPTEPYTLAATKKKSILGASKKEDFQTAAAAHWHFLVGNKANIDKVADQLGFRYKYIAAEKQYAHGAAIYIFSPDGKLNRVLPGLTASALDLKLAFLEAGEGKVGSFAEKFFALCYHYDPKESKYTILATSLMKLGGAITVGIFAIAYLALYLRRKERT